MSEVALSRALSFFDWEKMLDLRKHERFRRVMAMKSMTLFDNLWSESD